MRKYQYILLLMMMVSFLGSCTKSDSESNQEVAVKIGALAPDFTVNDTDGTAHTLSDYRGSYVVVDFWAAWCGICRGENPEMEQLHKNYKDKGLVVIGVSLDPDKQDWLEAITEDGLTFLQLGDQNAFDSEVAKTYGLGSVPFMLLLNPEGEIITVTSRVVDIESRVEIILE